MNDLPHRAQPQSTTDVWYRRLARGVRDTLAWASRKHLPTFLSVAALVLLLIAERRLLKEVLHAQEGLRDALGGLRVTVDDELGAARRALEDTRALENTSAAGSTPCTEGS